MAPPASPLRRTAAPPAHPLKLAAAAEKQPALPSNAPRPSPAAVARAALAERHKALDKMAEALPGLSLEALRRK
jgi:hypothetical protein